MLRTAAILSLDVVGYTALMAADPSSTLANLQRVFEKIVKPTIRARDGRIVKLMGDGALIEFPSATNAIAAAEEIQQKLNGDATQVRAGVHVGDVTINGSDLFGDAVNIAARLQSLAPAGGAFVSNISVAIAGGALKTSLKPEGALRLKGVPLPVDVMSIDFEAEARVTNLERLAAQQEIRFATSKDGTKLAWATTGDGQLLVKAPNWNQHLEKDWSVSLIGWLPHLVMRYQLVRFDARCNGLSDRGVEDLSLERSVDDLEAVFDAAGIERAPVFGYSFGCCVAASFAARRPERVSGLILLNGFVQGLERRPGGRGKQVQAAMATMSEVGWDDAFPSVRDLFSQRFSPQASQDDQRAYAEFMLHTITGEEYPRIGGSAVGNLDIDDLLPTISCPALVLHANREMMHGIDQGRRLAAGIPNARFVSLDTANNLMPSYDPAWPNALAEIETFIKSL